MVYGRQKQIHTILYHLYLESKIAKLLEKENRMVVVRANSSGNDVGQRV